MDIVYQRGRTWRYEFNAKTSGVLIYGEDDLNIPGNMYMRHYRLGTAEVKESNFYDHVGIRPSVDQFDISGIEDRLEKARKTLNASTGLGIRKSGLTMATCNIIFWSMVVPSATYGSEFGS